MRVVIIISPTIFIDECVYLNELFKFNLMIIDEGHKAKNIHTKFRKAAKLFRVTD